MKRSKAITMLCERISTYDLFSNKHPTEFIELSRVILDFIENEIKMLPPNLFRVVANSDQLNKATWLAFKWDDENERI